MAIKDKNTLKSWYQRGMAPTASQFGDWIDSYWHKNEKLTISEIENLQEILDDKTAHTITMILEQRIGELEEKSQSATELFKIVEILPATGEENIFYLVPAAGSTGSQFYNYIWVDNQWKSLGDFSTDVDLKGYYSKIETDSLLNKKIEDISKPMSYIGDTNITTDNFSVIILASDGKTYFSGAEGIKVLDESTGLIVGTNISAGTYNIAGIGSDGKTYFAGTQDGIKVLNESTGLFEETNITSGGYFSLGIASNGKTYFVGNSGINVLNESTGLIEETNINFDTYNSIGIGSDGKTYFTGDTGIKVLNEFTGLIEDTNITADTYSFIGIASDGKTYFGSGSKVGIKVLQTQYYIREHDKWVGLIAGDNITLTPDSVGDTLKISTTGGVTNEITVVQDTGTSTTSVISQKGVTDLLFYNGNKWNVQIGQNALATSESGGSPVAIGYNTTSTSGGVAIGYNSTSGASYSVTMGVSTKCRAPYSIALGYNSETVAGDILSSDPGYTGVFSIGSSTLKRRIINVRDGINDTDAVTVGQLNNHLVAGSNITLTNNIDGTKTISSVGGSGTSWFTSTTSTTATSYSFTKTTLTPSGTTPKVNDIILSASVYTYVITGITDTAASASRSTNIKGATGAQGARGYQGEQGPQGLPGISGGNINFDIQRSEDFYNLIATAGGDYDFMSHFAGDLSVYDWIYNYRHSFNGKEFTIYYDGLSGAVEEVLTMGHAIDYNTDLAEFMEYFYGRQLIRSGGGGDEKVLHAVATVNIKPSFEYMDCGGSLYDTFYRMLIADVKIEVPYIAGEHFDYTGQHIYQLPRTVKCQFYIHRHNVTMDLHSLEPRDFCDLEYQFF